MSSQLPDPGAREQPTRGRERSAADHASPAAATAATPRAGEPPEHGRAAPSAAGPGASPESPRVRYSERLTVAWWVWLIVAFVGGTGFVAVAPISIAVGVIVAAVLVVAIGLVLTLGAPRIVLTDEDLRVGRAYIERRYVGEAVAIRGADARAARGPDLDGRAFMNFRVSVPELCRISIVDPVDPTPYWLTATRHPDELARAVNEGRVRD